MGGAAPKAAGRKMSLYDGAMVRGNFSEKNGTPSIITCSVYFEILPSRDEIERMVRDKLLSFDTLAGRPISGRWVPAKLELEKHIFHTKADGESSVDALIETIANTPLANEAGGPWWEMHVIDCGPSASSHPIVVRFHHAVADGIALLQVLTRVATTADGSPLPPASFQRAPRPRRSITAVLWDFVRSLCKNLSLPISAFDADMPINPPLAERKKLAYNGRRKIVNVPPHSINVLKRIKNAAGDTHTINDVVFAAMAGAMHRYSLEVKPGHVFKHTQQCRALMPVTFPRAADADLTNDWSIVSVSFPITTASPKERLDEAHTTLAALKGSSEVSLARSIVNLNSMMPKMIAQQTASDLFSRHSLVFSNVPGPADPVYVCGKKVIGIRSMFPNLITQVLTASYGGSMWMTLAVDEHVITQAELIPKLYLEEIRQMAVACGVDPDDESEPPPRASKFPSQGIAMV